MVWVGGSLAFSCGLHSLIIRLTNLLVQGSLEDWDDNMQTECAKAFIEILQNDVSEELTISRINFIWVGLQQVTVLNVQRTLSLAVEITTNEDQENKNVSVHAWRLTCPSCAACRRVDRRAGELRRPR